MSEKVNGGAAKVEEMRAENQLGFIFDNINIGKVVYVEWICFLLKKNSFR